MWHTWRCNPTVQVQLQQLQNCSETRVSVTEALRNITTVSEYVRNINTYSSVLRGVLEV